MGKQSTYEAEWDRMCQRFIRDLHKRSQLHQASARFQRRIACDDLADLLMYAREHGDQLAWQASLNFGDDA